MTIFRAHSGKTEGTSSRPRQPRPQDHHVQRPVWREERMQVVHERGGQRDSRRQTKAAQPLAPSDAETSGSCRASRAPSQAAQGHTHASSRQLSLVWLSLAPPATVQRAREE